MKIVIFDDDPQFVELVKNTLADLNKKHNGLFGLSVCFDNANDTLEYIKTHADSLTIYLLDIIADDSQAGFEIAECIKNLCPDNLIIYITDFKEEILSNMVQKMRSSAFIFKDSERFEAELEEGLLYAHDLFEGKYFISKDFTDVVKIKYSDIYYFKKKKTTPHVYVIHKDGCAIIKSSLNSLMKQLNNSFCYSTKEFIVNTQAVTNIEKSEKILHFENGKQCPYSRTRKKELFECILK
jgi:DNA-binding LytR/AlgR family response regulator